MRRDSGWERKRVTDFSVNVSNEKVLKSYELVIMELRSGQEHTQELGK